MISVNEACNLLKARVKVLPSESVALHQSAGRALRQSLNADRDYPPFDRVAMDGYALVFSTLQKGQTRFVIQELQTAGQAPAQLRTPEACIEIMTGAQLPAGCDLVIRYEDTERQGAEVHIKSGLDLQPFSNIHRRAEDTKQGTAFADSLMTPPIAALAASFGLGRLEVSARARVVILGTGDELVPIHVDPLPYQIRASNIHAVRMALEQSGHEVLRCEVLADHQQKITSEVSEALQHCDVLLLSGGVSAGKTDFIPAVLKACGVQEVFHKIAQRPGKPLWFGQTPGGKTVFGLPGNPVSTLICLFRYVLPYLQAMQGLPETPRPLAELLSGPRAPAQLTQFVPVSLAYTADARILATPRLHHGSGDFVSLSGTDGFLEIPGVAEPEYDPGQKTFSFYSWSAC